MNTMLKMKSKRTGRNKLNFKESRQQLWQHVGDLSRLLLLSLGPASTLFQRLSSSSSLLGPFLCLCRNKETNRDEFIFYSKRLMRLLIEHALSFLPLKVSFCVCVELTDLLLLINVKVKCCCSELCH